MPDPDHKTQRTEPTLAAPPFVPSDRSEFPFLREPRATGETGWLGPYRVLGVLGKGGMGVVFRAEDPQLGRQIALKVMLPEFAAGVKARARFQREARAQAAVEHDHVAVIYHVGEDAGVPFIVMPLLKGMTLHAALKANPRPPLNAAVRIAREMAEGLAAAHALGLVHRDIKPSNVWLETPHLRVKILDFGLACGSDETVVGSTEAEPLTGSGAVIGTPAYMSPEQAWGRVTDPRTDLFSLGVVLYEMLAGRKPFVASNPRALLALLTTGKMPPLAEHNPAVPPALAALVDRLLAKEPEERPPSAAAAAEELRQVELGLIAGVQVVALDPIPGLPAAQDPFQELDATEAAGETAPSGSHTPRPAPARERGFPVWAVAVAVVALTAGFVWFVLNYRAPRPLAGGPPDTVPTARGPGNGEGDKPRPPVPDPAFIGRGLAGWTCRDPNCWRWDDKTGELVGTSAGPRTGANLYTERKYRDFEWSYQVLMRGASGATGVMVRGQVQKGGLAAHGTWCRTPKTGGSGAVWGAVEFSGTAPPPPPIEADAQKAVQATIRPGEYTDVTVRCVGRRVIITVNGVVAFNQDLDIPDEGGLGWLFGDRTEEVRFRNIRFTELNRVREGDRKAFDALRGHFASIKVVPVGGSELTLGPTDPPPAGPFRVAVLAGPVKDAAADFATQVLVPNVQLLDGLEGIRDATPALRLTAADLDALARTRSGGTLAELTAAVEPHAASLAALRQFPNLARLALDAFHYGDAHCAAVERLAGVRELALWNPGHAPGLGDAGWAAIGRPGLTSLTLVNPKGLTHTRIASLVCKSDLGQLVLNNARLDVDAVAALAGFPKLTRLNLAACTFPDDALQPLARLRTLTTFVASDTTLGDKGLEHLAACTGLKSVTVTRTQVTKAGVERFAAALPRCTIEWGKDQVIEPADPDYREAARLLARGGAVGVRLPDGKTVAPATPSELPDGPFVLVRVEPRSPLTDADLKRWEVLPELAEVSAADGHQLTAAGFLSLAKLKSLRTLTLAGKPVTDDALKTLAGLGDLTGLNLDRTKLPDAGLKALAALPRLESLSLHDTFVSDASAEVLAGMKGLKKLAITNTRVTDAGFKKLAAARPDLKVEWDDPDRRAVAALKPYVYALSIRREGVPGTGTLQRVHKPPAEPFTLVGVTFEDAPLAPDFTDTVFFPVVEKLSGLESISDPPGTQFLSTPGVLERLAALPVCGTMNYVFGNFPLTAKAAATLGRFPKLRTLACDAAGADDDVLAKLAAAWPNPYHLTLRNLGASGKVTEKGWATLTALNPRMLHLDGARSLDAAAARKLVRTRPPEYRLYLTDSDAGDDAVAELAKSPQLIWFGLAGTKVTDKGLEYLAGMKGLTVLDVKGTRVTEAGVKKLAAALPKCKIEWFGGTIEPK